MEADVLDRLDGRPLGLIRHPEQHRLGRDDRRGDDPRHVSCEFVVELGQRAPLRQRHPSSTAVDPTRADALCGSELASVDAGDCGAPAEHAPKRTDLTAVPSRFSVARESSQGMTHLVNSHPLQPV